MTLSTDKHGQNNFPRFKVVYGACLKAVLSFWPCLSYNGCVRLLKILVFEEALVVNLGPNESLCETAINGKET